MTAFEIFSFFLNTLAAIGAVIFGARQIKINARMAALDDFVTLAIVPNPDPSYPSLKLIILEALTYISMDILLTQTSKYTDGQYSFLPEPLMVHITGFLLISFLRLESSI
jgi:hypothetical protein